MSVLSRTTVIQICGRTTVVSFAAVSCNISNQLYLYAHEYKAYSNSVEGSLLVPFLIVIWPLRIKGILEVEALCCIYIPGYEFMYKFQFRIF